MRIIVFFAIDFGKLLEFFSVMTTRSASILTILVSLLQPGAAIRLVGTGVGRRNAIKQFGAAGLGLGLTGQQLPAAVAFADSEIESVVPMSTLLAGLAAAPARNIIITGANSGVGLAGAKCAYNPKRTFNHPVAPSILPMRAATPTGSGGALAELPPLATQPRFNPRCSKL